MSSSPSLLILKPRRHSTSHVKPTVITPLLNSFITQADIPTEGKKNGPAGPSGLECLAVRYRYQKQNKQKNPTSNLIYTSVYCVIG